MRVSKNRKTFFGGKGCAFRFLWTYPSTWNPRSQAKEIIMEEFAAVKIRLCRSTSIAALHLANLLSVMGCGRQLVVPRLRRHDGPKNSLVCSSKNSIPIRRFWLLEYCTGELCHLKCASSTRSCPASKG